MEGQNIGQKVKLLTEMSTMWNYYAEQAWLMGCKHQVPLFSSFSIAVSVDFMGLSGSSLAPGSRLRKAK